MIAHERIHPASNPVKPARLISVAEEGTVLLATMTAAPRPLYLSPDVNVGSGHFDPNRVAFSRLVIAGAFGTSHDSLFLLVRDWTTIIA